MIMNFITIFTLICLILIPGKGNTQDYLFDFVSEVYKERSANFGKQMKIYHCLQVNSITGPKLLILTGNDNEYRTWLREHIANNKKIVVNVPDKDDDYFKDSKAYKINVNSVHAANKEKWNKNNKSNYGTMPASNNKKYILIVEHNPEKRELIAMVVKNLGYSVTLSGKASEALKILKTEPEKFSMIITDNIVPEMSALGLVKNLIAANINIPIIIGTGYNNKIKDNILHTFANLDNIVIKSVIMRELPKTIITLLTQS
ncbi:MAG: hypothetical protein B6I26_03670 [Desulfobacteraceae bacterium 4572_130]|nr:MAG: hypothetical protein B6I26_03670 [Desulfobacteraceae bacterium 4572_130]